LARAAVALAEARISDRAGDPRRALRALGDARLDLADGGYGLEQEALRLEARALARIGRLDSAATIGRRAVAALERVRGSYGSSVLRTSYLADKRGAHDDLAEVLRHLGRAEEAFEVVDAARSRALVEGLAAARGSAPSARVADGVLRQGDELLREIDALTQQVRIAEADAPEAPDSGAAARIGFLRERLAGERRRYEEVAIRQDELRAPGAALLGVGWTPAAAVLSSLERTKR
jgi:hypothetical protein